MPCVDWEGGSGVTERHKPKSVEVPSKEHGGAR